MKKGTKKNLLKRPHKMLSLDVFEISEKSPNKKGKEDQGGKCHDLLFFAVKDSLLVVLPKELLMLLSVFPFFFGF